jgi:OOP family OmpA-OmpF porin
MLAASKLKPRDVVETWKPYRALDPDIVSARARSLLAAPRTVSLRVTGGALLASGTAPHRWIAEARRLAQTFADVTNYDDRGVTDTDQANLDSARKKLESLRIFFARGSSEPSPGETDKLERAAREVAGLPALALAAGRGIRIEVVGRGDSEGSEEVNLALSRRRAEGVLALLRARLPSASLAATGVGSGRPLVEERTEEDKQMNRSVSFRAIEDDAGAPGASR